MGGNLILNFLLKITEDISAAIATGPYLRLGFEPQNGKYSSPNLCKYIPGLSQPTALEQRALSRTPQVITEYQNDPLVHGMIKLPPHFL